LNILHLRYGKYTTLFLTITTHLLPTVCISIYDGDVPRHPRYQLTAPLYQLIALLLQEWQTLAGIALQLLPYLTQSRHQGMYEVLEYDSTLELLDPYGHEAIFRKRQKVRCQTRNEMSSNRRLKMSPNHRSQCPLDAGTV